LAAEARQIRPDLDLIMIWLSHDYTVHEMGLGLPT
jgi:hypothetical protein